MKQRLESDLSEWIDWLYEIDDRRLLARAAKMDIDVDDIPFPSPAPAERPTYVEFLSHFEHGPFGNRLLTFHARKALKAKVRERAPAYRKEQRERWELIIKAIPFVTGLIGTGIGLVSAFSWLLHK